jgi:uncharacterized protein YecE (DUF72 family)
MAIGEVSPALIEPSGEAGLAVATPLRLHAADVRAGTCSWADRTLIAQSDFYPRRSMSASDRLAWYCSRFPVAEITGTYRFPPTPEQSTRWVQRTPDGFHFDVRAWSLLTGNPTFPDSLWPDLQPTLRPANRERRRLYPHHLPSDALEECWARFAHALRPLASAGRLGAVVLRYPSWFTPRPETRAELTAAASRLPDYRLAMELRSPKWFEAATCEDTLELLEALGVALVCVDGPTADPAAAGAPVETESTAPFSVVAATSDLAVVRFVGRRQVEGDPWPWPYRYSERELAQWVPRIDDLASSAGEVHLLLENTWRDDAVDGARRLLDLLDQSE